MKNKLLIIQTAFIGDVILATSLVETISKMHPTFEIDFLCRKGNESILNNNPHIRKILIWDKSHYKFYSLCKMVLEVRKEKYDFILNIQRFFNSGLITALSGAKKTIGFHSNPLSILFSQKVTHKIPHKTADSFLHEVQRNSQLLRIIDPKLEIPKSESIPMRIYFSEKDKESIKDLNLNLHYIVMAPASVWYTKQWHKNKWKHLISLLNKKYQIILIGAPSDSEYLSFFETDNVINLAGKLNLRESALLMKAAAQVFVNDSAPLHLASSVDAKTTAIFCSTIPDFGYGPLSSEKRIIQVSPRLECMPCGLHGHKQCPLTHFSCSEKIDVEIVADF